MKMNIKYIKSLAKILEESGLTAIEVCEGDVSCRLERSAAQAEPASIRPHEAFPPAPVAEPICQEDGAINFNRVNEVKSPMVGVFYAAPSPESEPFVSIGQRVKKGDVLCIIEAMKLMNEITSDFDGEIVDICVENGQIVEFGQTIFKIY